MKEIWKDIPNYEGHYQVSNLGNVKSIRFNREKLLSPSIYKGYLSVVLYKNKIRTTKRIHQLVAMAFLNHIPCGLYLVVNHINLNNSDNRLVNLEVISARKNTNKKHLKSSSIYTGVSYSKSGKKWRSIIGIKKTRIFLGDYKDEKKASEIYELAVKLVDKYNGVAKDFRELVKKEYEQNINRSNKLYK